MGCEEEAAVYATGAAAAEIYRLISTSRTHASKMALRKEKITASKRSFPFL
jgi:thioredoxin reductase